MEPLIIYLIAIVIALILFGVFASMFYTIAQEKGYDERKYFWIPFLFGIPGWVLVAALPDLRARNQIEELEEKLKKLPVPAAPVARPTAPANDSLPTL